MLPGSPLPQNRDGPDAGLRDPMTFFSYAPSFEDVLLRRAFKDVEKGFYVEVGAGHPVEGSLTYALYQAGWRGLTVEPKSEVADLFVRERPEDTHLMLLAAAENRDQVVYHAWTGSDMRPASPATTREERRLGDILADHAPAAIQVLAIRTHRAAEVLKGLDLTQHRPWLILIGETGDEDLAAAQALLAAGSYEEAHFDGLNRFYLAAEQAGRLAHHFRAPINARDGVITVRDGTSAPLTLALAERDRLERDLRRAKHLRRLAEEKARLAFGLRPNWPRRLDLPRREQKPTAVAPADRKPVLKDPDALSITVTGHINGSYSLAVVNRNYAEALATFSRAHVRVEPIEGGEKRGITHVEGPDRVLMESLAAAPAIASRRKVAISQHYPPFVPEGDFDLRLMVFFWEESIVPPAIVDLINGGFDAVLVATRFVAKVLVDSGVHIPVRVVRHPGRFDAFKALRAERLARGAKAPDEETVFLHVSSCFPRKGVDRLIEAYLAAFSADDPVRLIIKGFPNPHNAVAAQIAEARARQPNRAPITFLNEDMSEERLLALYRRADAVVLPTRGEGLNLPAAEAVTSGLPLIVTGFGGQVDFCASDTVSLVDFAFAPSGSHLAEPGSVWADPDVEDLRAALTAMRQRLAAEPFLPDTEDVEAFFDRESFARRIEEVIAEVAEPWWDESRPLKVAWVSTYEVRCGIAEYSRHLITAWKTHGPDITVLADTRTPPDLPTPQELENLHPLWEPGNWKSFEASAETLGALQPDVVVIQYHPAYFGWLAMEALIEEAQRQKAVVVVTLHNVRWLAHPPLPERLSARRALEAVDRIIVHTVLDLNFLKHLGFIDNVVLIPQGVAVIDSLPPDRGVALAADGPLIGCYGFFLPHKGIHALIEAFAEIRHAWPTARLRLVNAEYPAPLSAAELARCRATAERLGLAEAIEWHTAFLPHEASVALLAGCDVVVLPYEDTNEASSAAARGALSSRRPVLVTPIQIFEELGDAVFRLPGADKAGIARGLAEVLADEGLRRTTLTQAFKWLDRHDWRAIAARFNAMIRGLQKAERRKGLA